MTRRDLFSSMAAFVDVTSTGAVGDGRTLNTQALQKAIDAVGARGGGVVLLPPGKFVSGTLVLRSGVTLRLEPGSFLIGSTNLNDYPEIPNVIRSFTDTYTVRSLIVAQKCENVGIEGSGTIDGQGKAFSGPYKVRPYTLRFVSCTGVHVNDITIRDSPMWVQHYLDCERVLIHGQTVISRVNHNNDGIDIDACRRVRISDCDIWSGDDAIVLKSTANIICRDVTVSNCTLSTLCNALKLGTESNGGFENIVFTGCSIYDTRLAGLALEMVDGGTLDRISVSHLVMDRVGAPIFLRLGDRGRPFTEGGPRPPVGRFRRVHISDVQATGCGPTGCALAGLPGHPIEDVTLENIRLEFAGGGTAEEAAREVPENPDKYPEYGMFGRLPAYGLYCRHAKGLSLRHISLRTEKPDARPAIVHQDVTMDV